jgi:copper homeostasis protein
VRDRQVALEALIELGVDRVLTSGGAASALEGAEMLAELVDQGGTDIVILAGGGINASNVADVVRLSGVNEVHVRAAGSIKSEMTHRRTDITLARPQPLGDYDRVVTRADEMRRVVTALSGSPRPVAG